MEAIKIQIIERKTRSRFYRMARNSNRSRRYPKNFSLVFELKVCSRLVKDPEQCYTSVLVRRLCPWLSWSRFFRGETKLYLKTVDEKNSYSLIFTGAAWLRPDKPDEVISLGKPVFDQIKEINCVHPAQGKEIKVSNTKL